MKRLYSDLMVLMALVPVLAAGQTSVTDTIRIDSISTHSGQSVILNVSLVNADTIHGIDLPLTYDYSDLTVDSVSFVGSRALGELLTLDTVVAESAFIHIGAINFTGQELEPGRGLLAKIFVSIPDGYPTRTIFFDSTTFRTGLTLVDKHNSSYTPVFRKGVMVNSFAPATSDSFWVENVQIDAGDKFAVALSLTNDLPLTSIRLPLRYLSDNLVLDSVSVAGTRAEHVIFPQITIDGISKTVLISLDFTEQLPLNPGTGSCANLYFTSVIGGTSSAVVLDTTTLFGSHLYCRLGAIYNNVQIYPDYRPGTIAILDVSDLTVVSEQVPREYALDQNSPNPFNPTTTIHFALPRQSDVRLTVYNILGQEVRTLIDNSLAAGTYVVSFDGTDDRGQEVASGVYLYRLTASAFSETRKMMLVK